MGISQSILPEFDREMDNTRRTLERVPEDKLAWKPHPKSPTMGWLAGHLANLVSWATETVNQEFIDLDAYSAAPPEPKSRAAILELFDRNRAAARAAIERAGDPIFMQPWSLKKGGQTIFTMPKLAVLRSFVMNHAIHHRAQLGVYLRLNDVPVPALYGPSADEAGM